MPNIANIIRASKMPGKLTFKSTARIITDSTQPPFVAAKSPRITPIVVPIDTATNATNRLNRSPYITADNISRPRASVPSQAVSPFPSFDRGGNKPSIISKTIKSYGFCGAIHGAKSAVKTNITKPIKPAIAIG